MAHDDTKQAMRASFMKNIILQNVPKKVHIKRKKVTLKETYHVFPELVFHQILCTYT